MIEDESVTLIKNIFYLYLKLRIMYVGVKSLDI